MKRKKPEAKTKTITRTNITYRLFNVVCETNYVGYTSCASVSLIDGGITMGSH